MLDWPPGQRTTTQRSPESPGQGCVGQDVEGAPRPGSGTWKSPEPAAQGLYGAPWACGLVIELPGPAQRMGCRRDRGWRPHPITRRGLFTWRGRHSSAKLLGTEADTHGSCRFMPTATL